ncbi:Ig-like domain-containing protein (plasmid) [Haladaptatus sp. SPP-AMP-3]|uniref:Ig-like domain-containing protein n=1 Tax=Haladaptatus sp. SPP-AMP-3 TaxID=3121295 RepID=UPI003C2ECAEA
MDLAVDDVAFLARPIASPSCGPSPTSLPTGAATVGVDVLATPYRDPVTAPDTYYTFEDESLSVDDPGILGNDYDPDGGTLDIGVYVQATNGTASLSDGSFVYTPDPGFVGVDSFTYRVADGRGATTAPTTVTVTVVDPSGQADAATSPDRVDFGAVESGSTDAAAVSVTNVGGADLAISDVRIDGPDADAFAVVAGGTAASLSTAESHTVMVRAAPTGAGDRTARLVLSTTDADRRIVWIPLTATGEAGEDGGGTGSGGESGGSSPTDSGTDGTDSNRSSVTVRRNGDWTNVSVDGSNRNGHVNVTFADGDRTSDDAGNDSDARLLGVNVITDVDRSMTFNVTAEDEPSENTTDFHASVGGEAFGYLRIDHSVPDEDISGVTLEFFVSRDRFTELGVAPDDVALYRYHDGAWTELPTRLVRNEDGGYVFRADSPGLSTFAIASPPASDAPPAQTDTDGRVTPTSEPTGVATTTATTTTTAIPTTATTDGTGPGFTAAGLAAVVLALLVYLDLRRRE